MLNAKITRASVRTGACPLIQRSPSAMSRRTWLSGTPRTPPRGVAIRATRTTLNPTQRTCTRNGQTIPAAKRNAPTGGPTSWLAVRNPACNRPLPTPRSGLGTSIGSNVPVVVSANTSATP